MKHTANISPQVEADEIPVQAETITPDTTITPTELISDDAENIEYVVQVSLN